MKIICNGEDRQVLVGTTIGKLIIDLGLEPEFVVAECDGKILKRDDYDTVQVNDGSVVELIRFVGGG